MTMWLYPRLPPAIGDALAQERATESIAALEKLSSCEHPDAVYGPTGGGRVPKSTLEELRAAVLKVATACGFPSGLGEKEKRRFDAECAALLHTMMGIVAAEAAQVGVWT